MAHTVALSAERRAHTGKGAARQLRAQGKIPAVVYGQGREPEPLLVGAYDLEKALVGIAAESTIIDLSVGGQTIKTLIREIQRHPVRLKILHVDFYEIHADQTITLEVPVHLEGVPDGVRNAGGVLDQVLRTLEIEVLPADIPERISVDVTNLSIGKSLHVRDITVERATILTDANATVCTVVAPRAEEAPPAAGEAIAEVAEPELIRKPKAEGEEEVAPEAEPETKGKGKAKED